MSSDNGKAGEIDFYDVLGVCEYLERKYSGTVQLLVEQAPRAQRGLVLLHATFVRNDMLAPRGAGIMQEVPFSPNALRRVPGRFHDMLLELQETIDDQAASLILKAYR